MLGHRRTRPRSNPDPPPVPTTPYQKRIAWVFKNYRHEPAVGIYTHRFLERMQGWHRVSGPTQLFQRDGLQPMTDQAAQGYMAEAISSEMRAPGLEPLIPWLASVIYANIKQLRRDQIADQDDPYKERLREAYQEFFANLRNIAVEFHDVYDWVNATHPNIMAMTWAQALTAATAWHREMAAQDRREEEEARTRLPVPGRIVFRFGDGWTVHSLSSKEQLKDEGRAMAHCVGLASNYYNRIVSGEAKILSLRDEDGRPTVTMELMKYIRLQGTNVDAWRVVQAKGFSNELIDWSKPGDEAACRHLLEFSGLVDPNNAKFDKDLSFSIGLVIFDWDRNGDMHHCLSAPWGRP